MRALFSWLIRLSRPHIWIYTIGPFYLGTIVAQKGNIGIYNWEHPLIILFFILWLTLPANIFTYGLNDIFDYATDLKNPKKVKFEKTLSLLEQKRAVLAAFFAVLPLIIVIPILPPFVAFLVATWLLIILSYNIPPFRLKGRPIWDFVFGFSYPIWGIVGYTLVSSTPHINLLIILTLFLAGSAFHLYASISDRRWDEIAQLRTTAVAIGSTTKNLWISGVFFGIAAPILYFQGYYKIAFFSIIFPLFFMLQIFFGTEDEQSLLSWYRAMILFQYVAGFTLSFIIT